ncbi:uncharacterized protein LOC111832177 [Capsella rubella]|uniref:uncharacterized protein LOC111832177 n=1 Tax=Capsella rubella TaxID=81985 RepID=UPI000CD53A8F|nr:uncharacterized protein LOC111832177 [Capsella rubella]
MRVGNGLTCRFWTDNWSPFGRLSTFLSDTATSRLGIRQQSTLSQLYNRGTWMLPNPRSDTQLSLHIFLTTLSLSNFDDHYEWELDGKTYTRYSTGQVYRAITMQSPLVPWREVVWFSGSIPKHSFLTWLLVQNRCPTRDRILGWGLQTDPLCLLCGSSPESRDHIWFDCGFAWSIWENIASRCGISPLRSWEASLHHLQGMNGDKARRRLTLLAWQCSLYLIWAERNNRLHRCSFRSVDDLLRQIDTTIRNRIASYRDSNSSIASLMLQHWFSSA